MNPDDNFIIFNNSSSLHSRNSPYSQDKLSSRAKKNVLFKLQKLWSTYCKLLPLLSWYATETCPHSFFQNSQSLTRVEREPTLTYVCAQLLSRVWLFVTPWNVALQAPLSMRFSQQEYWSGVPFPTPGDLPDPGIKCTFLSLLHWQADSLPLVPPGKLLNCWQQGITWFRYISYVPRMSAHTYTQWRKKEALENVLK